MGVTPTELEAIHNTLEVQGLTFDIIREEGAQRKRIMEDLSSVAKLGTAYNSNFIETELTILNHIVSDAASLTNFPIKLSAQTNGTTSVDLKRPGNFLALTIIVASGFSLKAYTAEDGYFDVKPDEAYDDFLVQNKPVYLIADKAPIITRKAGNEKYVALNMHEGEDENSEFVCCQLALELKDTTKAKSNTNPIILKFKAPNGADYQYFDEADIMAYIRNDPESQEVIFGPNRHDVAANKEKN